MFCHICGKEINEGQAFCTSCGTKVWKAEEKAEEPVAEEVIVEEVVEEPVAEEVIVEEAIEEPVVEEVIEEPEVEEVIAEPEVIEEPVVAEEPVVTEEPVVAEPVKKKGKGLKIFIALVVVIAAAIGIAYFFVRPAIIEKTINEQTTKIMEEVKSGPSEATLNKIVTGAVDDLTSNTYVRSYIKKNLTGENLKDIYSALVANMSYSTKLVKVDNDNYRIDITVKTVNNVTAAKNAISLYTGDHNIINAVTDWLKSDKSQLIKEYLTKASNNLAKSGDYMTSKISINIKITGLADAEVEADAVEIGMRCLGLPGYTS